MHQQKSLFWFHKLYRSMLWQRAITIATIAVFLTFALLMLAMVIIIPIFHQGQPIPILPIHIGSVFLWRIICFFSVRYYYKDETSPKSLASWILLAALMIIVSKLLDYTLSFITWDWNTLPDPYSIDERSKLWTYVVIVAYVYTLIKHRFAESDFDFFWWDALQKK